MYVGTGKVAGRDRDSYLMGVILVCYVGTLCSVNLPAIVECQGSSLAMSGGHLTSTALCNIDIWTDRRVFFSGLGSCLSGKGQFTNNFKVLNRIITEG